LPALDSQDARVHYSSRRHRDYKVKEEKKEVKAKKLKGRKRRKNNKETVNGDKIRYAERRQLWQGIVEALLINTIGFS
jgi:hypothetical protein